MLRFISLLGVLILREEGSGEEIPLSVVKSSWLALSSSASASVHRRIWENIIRGEKYCRNHSRFIQSSSK